MSVERNQSGVEREQLEENRAQAGNPLDSGNGNSSAISQKKKGGDNLLDLFSEHKDIGNWADAASEDFPSFQKSDSVDAKSGVEHVGERSTANNEFRTVHGDSSFHGGPASHSHCGANEEPPLQLFISNIPYSAREEDLFYFFGGDEAITHIQLSQGSRPDLNNGTAVITFQSLEAYMRGREFENKVFCGRPLKVREHRRQPIPYREKRGYTDRQSNIMDGYPPRPSGGYGNQQYYEEGTFPRPRKNASYGAVPSNFVQNDNHSDFRRLQQNNSSFRHSHSMQNTRPNYRGRNSYGGAPLRKSPSEDGGMRGYDPSFRNVRKGSYANDGQRPSLFAQQVQTEPAHRRKLELAPRTIPLGESKIEPPRSSSIFGEAKPVDTSEKEREFEERLDREDRVTRTSRSRKASSEVGASHPTTPTLPPVIPPLHKTANVMESQIPDSNIPPVEEEKSISEISIKPSLPPVEVSTKENHVLTQTVEAMQGRKLSSGAPLLIHSQSLPPLPKMQSKENVHETSGPINTSKPPVRMVFLNSSLKSKTYGGRRSDRGRERSYYGSSHHHDGVIKHSSETSQQNYSESGNYVRDDRSKRKGSVSSSNKEQSVPLEKNKRSLMVSKSAVNVEQQLKESEAKTKDILEKPKENNAKSTTKVKDDSSKNRREKVTTNREKKKANSTKTMPKLNAKPSVVSTKNKFAALLETNE